MGNGIFRGVHPPARLAGNKIAFVRAFIIKGYVWRITLGLADRFANSFVDSREKTSFMMQRTEKDKNLFLIENGALDKKMLFNSLKDELFEKIVTVPCWCDYDTQTQYSLIVKFLQTKNIKNPEIFAKVLQHSILGFGVFDDYLAKNDISCIRYEQGKAFEYVLSGQDCVDNEVIFPIAKVRSVVKNLVNLSKKPSRAGAFEFRYADFWVEMYVPESSGIKITVTKIDKSFIEREIDCLQLVYSLSDVK